MKTVDKRHLVPINIVIDADDMELDIYLPLDDKPEVLKASIIRVSEELQAVPLNGAPVERVYLPFKDEGEDGWQQTHFETSDFKNFRYWGIDRFGYLEGIYDLKTGKITQTDEVEGIIKLEAE